VIGSRAAINHATPLEIQHFPAVAVVDVLPDDIGLPWGDTKILLLAICISDENPEEAVN
jgi:mannitol/fructose-specific phosphotransferase system IIA component